MPDWEKIFRDLTYMPLRGHVGTRGLPELLEARRKRGGKKPADPLEPIREWRSAVNQGQFPVPPPERPYYRSPEQGAARPPLEPLTWSGRSDREKWTDAYRRRQKWSEGYQRGRTEAAPSEAPQPLRGKSRRWLAKQMKAYGAEMPEDVGLQREMLSLFMDPEAKKGLRRAQRLSGELGRGRARDTVSPFDVLREGINETYGAVEAGRTYTQRDMSKTVRGQYRDKVFIDPISGEQVVRPSTMRKQDFERLKMARMDAANKAASDKATALADVDARQLGAELTGLATGFEPTGVPQFDQIRYQEMVRQLNRRDQRAESSQVSRMLGLPDTGDLSPGTALGLDEANRRQQAQDFGMMRYLEGEAEKARGLQKMSELGQALPDAEGPMYQAVKEFMKNGMGDPRMFPALMGQMGASLSRQDQQAKEQQAFMLQLQKMQLDQEGAQRDYVEQRRGGLQKTYTDAVKQLLDVRGDLPAIRPEMGMAGKAQELMDPKSGEYASLHESLGRQSDALLQGTQALMQLLTGLDALKLGDEDTQALFKDFTGKDRTSMASNLKAYLGSGETEETLQEYAKLNPDALQGMDINEWLTQNKGTRRRQTLREYETAMSGELDQLYQYLLAVGIPLLGG